MTEAEWLACDDPKPMVTFLRGKGSDRKLRLFAVACCRHVWQLLEDSRSREAVEVAERYADGLAEASEAQAAHTAANNARCAIMRKWTTDIVPRLVGAVAAKRVIAHKEAGWRKAAKVAADVRHAIKLTGNNAGQEQLWQASVVRDIFGNPFRPSPHLPRAVIAWSDSTVRRMAEAIYAERQIPKGTLDTGRLAILGDALLDAGCENEALIQHCREPGPHVRGCWVIDLLLGKE